MHCFRMPAYVTLLLVLLACSAGVESNGTAGTQNQTAERTRLELKIVPQFSGATLKFNDVSLTTKAGGSLSVSRVAFLISDITLIRDDGTRFDLNRQFGFINLSAGRDRVNLTDVPMGHWRGIGFTIGLKPEVNHADPSHYGPEHALNPRLNGLLWSWKGGYVFMALEGHYTRSDGGLGGYSYHIATDANRVDVQMPMNFTTAGDTEADIDLDASELFRNVSPGASPGSDSTHSAPGDKVAATIKSNIRQAFKLERVTVANFEIPAAVQPERIAAIPGTHPYEFRVPDGFPQPELPADNPMTTDGVSLGKRLFFDSRLSGNGLQSCASCHRPDAAFSDAGHAKSRGDFGEEGQRRTMPLFNLAWSGAYTWDGRRNRLRDQCLAPIVNKREMHGAMPLIIKTLERDSGYRKLFVAAFGTHDVTERRIGLAMEQYLLTLIAADSKFDRAAQGRAQFSDLEKRGLELFITEYDPARGKIGADCFHCHGGALFTDYRFTNNGLKLSEYDLGREAITGHAGDQGAFKTPSLRNVAITGPYMHDGRFKTLEEVIDHYTSGIHRTAALDPNIAKHPDSGMQLTSADKKALVAFLKTLTDSRFAEQKH